MRLKLRTTFLLSLPIPFEVKGHPQLLPMAAFLGCLLCILAIQVEAVTHPRDTSGLLALKAGLGEAAPSLASWRGVDPCGGPWEGITCNKTVTPWVVREVHLNDRKPKLAGQLPGPGSAFWNMTDLVTFDIMWNNVTGSLSEDVGNLASLQRLLLNGNQLSGPLPRSLGKLQYIDRIQIDQNQFSGPVPSELGDLPRFKHLHFNNNSLSGPIPASLGRLPCLFHLLLDNNNLSGTLPPEIGNISSLKIMQFDNNAGLHGNIPTTYARMPNLQKISMRSCKLNGTIPDLTGLPNLLSVDLTGNKLVGSLPPHLPGNTTTVSLSFNPLSGPIPDSYANLTYLQALYCESCGLNGTIPAAMGSTGYLASSNRSVIDLRNNSLTGGIPVGLRNGVNRNSLMLYLHGNGDLCYSEVSFQELCEAHVPAVGTSVEAAHTDLAEECHPCNKGLYLLVIPETLERQQCLCYSAVAIRMRLKSPSITFFWPFINDMRTFLTTSIFLDVAQLSITDLFWGPGPRLNFTVYVFPKIDGNSQVSQLAEEEVQRIFEILYNWNITEVHKFGPIEQLAFDPPRPDHVALSTGIILAIVIGCVVAGIVLGLLLLFLFNKITGRPIPTYRFYALKHGAVPWTATMPQLSACQVFSYTQLEAACDGFSDANCVGRGEYGHVYKGTLPNGDMVAVKIPNQKSLQGKEAFNTEIELLSRVHHRNLVNLVGFCCGTGHQALVYEFVPGGTLKQHLQGKGSQEEEALPFLRRVIIAIESAQAVNYLHRAASPPIIHRDIKTGNILLDKHLHSKVADFGLSKKAVDPYEESRWSQRMEGGSGSSWWKNVSKERKEWDESTSSRNPGHSAIKGTPGYVDPEYWATRQLTAKSDVYSFGVVLAELVTGLSPMHAMSKVYQLSEERIGLEDAVDPRMGSFPPEAMLCFVQLILKCVQPHGDARPSMADVIRSLEAVLQQLPQEGWETRAVLGKSARSALRSSAMPVISSSGGASSSSTSFRSGTSMSTSAMISGPTPFYIPGSAGKWDVTSVMDPSSTSFEATGTREFANAADLSFSIEPR